MDNVKHKSQDKKEYKSQAIPRSVKFEKNQDKDDSFKLQKPSDLDIPKRASMIGKGTRTLQPA